MRTTLAVALALACFTTVEAITINSMASSEFRDSRAGFKTSAAQSGHAEVVEEPEEKKEPAEEVEPKKKGKHGKRKAKKEKKESTDLDAFGKPSYLTLESYVPCMGANNTEACHAEQMSL